VEIGARTRLMANIYIEGPTWIGDGNIFYPYTTVGVASQDLKYKGERAETRIGHRNKIRESVTIHRGTEGGGLLTSIGDDNLLMAYTHVAHDVHVASHCVLANGVTLGGHVEIGEWAVVGAFTGVHQFCRIGRHAMVAGYSVITRDVAPYSVTAVEREARLFDVNKTGLERRGFGKDVIEQLHKAFRQLKSEKLNTSQAIGQIRRELAGCAEVDEVIRFFETSQRGVIK
jgi:UDP-N-acetylglucosamine acyltransferase